MVKDIQKASVLNLSSRLWIDPYWTIYWLDMHNQSLHDFENLFQNLNVPERYPGMAFYVTIFKI